MNGKKEKALAVGYSSHGEWSTLQRVRETEKERGNSFPDLTRYPDETPAIWVCKTRRKALRYFALADDWELIDSGKPLPRRLKKLLEDITEISLLPADIIAVEDGDGGYLILRPTTGLPKSLEDLAKACKAPVEHKRMRRWKLKKEEAKQK